MPNRDFTGPNGMGPMTGRGMGFRRGGGLGFNHGFGRGFGFGRGYGYVPAFSPNEIQNYSDKELIENEIKIMKERISFLEKQLEN